MRTRSLPLCVLLACGPSVVDSDGTDTDPTADDELPASCDAPPYDDACQDAFAERCEAQPDEPACGAVTSLPGGLALQCAWVEPERIVDSETCETEPAEPRCVGVAYPGDIGCSPYLQEEGDILVVVPDACFPIGWGECWDADAPDACACVNR